MMGAESAQVSGFQLLVGLLLAASVSSCGPSCGTDIGSSSALSVEFVSVVQSHPGEKLQAEACVVDVCQGLTDVDRKGEAVFRFGESVITDGAPRLVTLIVKNARSAVVFEGEATVTPVKREVNGAGCAPLTYQAEVVATGSGVLTTDPAERREAMVGADDEIRTREGSQKL